jgi:AbrB family looped-hinge helix DNA binding protein
METTLDKFGRIIIPKQIRDHLGLKTGEILEVEELENKVLLKPVKEESSLRVKEGLIVFSGTSIGDVAETVRTLRTERINEIIRSMKKRE